MAHYAKINENNIVEEVIVVSDNQLNPNKWLSELLGGTWVQTSYNSRDGIHYSSNSNTPSGKPHLRCNYAGIGFIYDPEIDVFYNPEAPFPSWVLNKTTYIWESTIPKPTDGPSWWNEDTKEWIKFPKLLQFNSWIWNNELQQYEPPVPMPINGGPWSWDEIDQEWYLSNPIAKID